MEDGILYNKENISIYCPESKKEECDFDSSILTNIPVLLEKDTNGSCGEDGTYVLFGDWPQTIKSDDVIIDDKHKYNINGWESYKGSDGCYYVKTEATYLGDHTISNDEKMINTFSNGKHIVYANIYYFKLESIKWRLLTNLYQGGNLLLAEKTLDSQCFDSHWEYEAAEFEGINRTIKETTIYANNYKYSSIRAYLNGLNGSDYDVDDFSNKGFINKAFTEKALDEINTVDVINNITSTASSWQGYFCEDTRDKIFLLSAQEVSNLDYGFCKVAESFLDDEVQLGISRRKDTSDYARAKGIFFKEQYDGTEVDTNSNWWLRSARADFNYLLCGVDSVGGIHSFTCTRKSCGVVPALSVSFAKKKYIVSKDGEGDFDNIREALKKANDGDKIFVKGGTYNENLIIDKDIEIIGDEKNIPMIYNESGTVCKVIADASFKFIHFNNSFNRINGNNNYFNDKKLGFYSLVEISSNAFFGNCEFSNSFDNGIMVYGNCIKPQFFNCIVHDTKTNGMYFLDGCEPIVYNCEIYNTEHQGIAINNSSPNIEKCKIHNGDVYGISISGNDSIVGRYYEDGEGVIIKEAYPIVMDCEIFNLDGKKTNGVATGISAVNSKGIYKYNVIHGINGYGMWSGGDDDHLVERCLIYDCGFGDEKKSCGIRLDDNSKGEYSNCEIYNISRFGIYVNNYAQVSINNCYIHDISGEKAAGILGKGDSNLDVESCEIYDIKGNKKYCSGIMLLGYGSGSFRYCKLHNIEGYGIGTSYDYEPEIKDCTFDKLKKTTGFNLKLGNDKEVVKVCELPEVDYATAKKELEKVSTSAESLEKLLELGNNIENGSEESNNYLIKGGWPESYKTNIDNINKSTKRKGKHKIKK